FLRRAELPANPGGVLALHLVSGVHQSIRQLARVGEEEQTGAVQVQPTDCNPAARGKRVEHRAPSLRVAPRDELADGLVVQEDPRLFRAGFRSLFRNRLSVDGDLITRTRPGAQADERAVDADASGRDPALYFSPRA